MRKIVMAVALALLLSIFAFNAFAAEEVHPHQGNHCVCGGSAVGVEDHTCTDLQWKPMPTNIKDFANLPDGNYYLTRDLTITGVTSFTNKKLTICLNGYNINTTANAVFGYAKQGSVINFCDCSGKQAADGTWTFGGTVTANQTGKARAYGGVINMNANTTLNVYGGNFVGAKGGSAKQGGVFNICNDGHGGADGDQNLDQYDTNFNFYNGHIIGGEVSSNGAAINTWHYVHVNLYGGTVTGGTGANRGNINISTYTTLNITNCLITGGNPGSVLVMEGNSYISQTPTLKEGLSKVKDGQYIRLLGDIHEEIPVASGKVIDLAGNNLSGVTVDAGAVIFDSTTDGYDGSNAGTLTPAGGTVQTTYKLNGKTYIALNDNGTYSFHRYYMSITKLTLKPKTVGMGYKATFVGSQQLKDALSNNIAFGYSMWLDESQKITRGFTADKFGGQQELTLRIDNFMEQSATAQENAERAEQNVYASVYLRLADGTYIETAPVCYNFRQMLELANKNFANYTTTQKSALQTLSATFSQSMISWDIHNIHHAGGSMWQITTNNTFNTLLKSNSNKLPSGNYALAGNVDIGGKTIVIPKGATVNICLNGYTLKSSVRMFNTHGTLNICDCHAADAEGYMISTTTIDSDETDIGEFTALIYTYASSVTNLYGGNLQVPNPMSYAGMIAVSHDDSDKTLPSGVFNMYGGTIHSCTVIGQSNKTAAGGNITLWNGSTFNLYGGVIHSGTAKNGGAFNITSGTTLNMYGGTITGGTANNGNGGNIYNAGTLNMYGGTITGGTANSGNGGNIYSSSGSTLKLAGGTITNGTVTAGEDTLATGFGGGIYIAGTATASGNLTFENNKDTDIYLYGTSTFNASSLSAATKISLYSQIRRSISDDAATLNCFTTTNENSAIKAVNGGVAIVPATLDTAAVDKKESTFRVGYNMTDIIPKESGLVMSSWGNPNGRKTNGVIGYTPYVTTTAITDKENNTVLMVTLDLQGPPPESVLPFIYQQISNATGVPADNIYLSATHTHNCPSTSSSTAGNLRYRYLVIDALVVSALEAMADRAPATMKTGSFDTAGMNYSRHYYYYKNNDKTTEKIYFGDQFGQKPSNGETIYRVRTGDPTMHMVSFERTDKQPVLIVNWRAHPHRSGGMTSYTVDADVIGATREYLHTNTNYLFAYYQGAAGNMNTTSRISGETYKSGKIKEYGNELGRQIVNGTAKLHSIETGLIQTKKIVYAAPVDHTQDDKIEQAKALQAYYQNNPDEMDTYEEQITVAATYGFTSVFHATRLITKYNLPATRDMELNIFSIGDSIGFYTAPAELWDSFSESLEGDSPFETTFCLGYCNGGVAYIPYKLDYYVAYEYFYCLFEQDTAIDQMREYYLNNLNEQYENAQ